MLRAPGPLTEPRFWEGILGTVILELAFRTHILEKADTWEGATPRFVARFTGTLGGAIGDMEGCAGV